ncbi:MAG: ABC transporter substrate-binding protein [Deltaproteobacteria bacterium]|nr:ABC transporter substrate-binding protein [Deltaproteobacteria bacterium]
MGSLHIAGPGPLAIALIASLLLSCGRPAPPDDELVFLIGSWPTNLDPRFVPDAWSEKIAHLVFSPLLIRDPRGELRPHLAESHEFASATEVIVRLRDDAYFHDRTPVRASDVVATYRSILDPALGSVKRLSLDAISDVSEVAPRTVRFSLHRPHAPFLQVLASIGIAQESEILANGTAGDVLWTGSGPFLFEEIDTGAHLLLGRNPEWFGGRVGVEHVRFRVVPDATVRSLELLRGSADITQNDLPPHVLDHLSASPDLVVETAESTLVKYLAFNLERPPLDDVRVRRAIAMAIDREAITRHKLRGFATVAHSFLHPDSWAYAGDISVLRHDPVGARALLDEAGLPQPADGSARLHLVFRTSQDETAIAVAKILRRDLAAVGIEMELRSNEWGVFFADIKQGDFDLYTLSGVGINDPDWYSFVMHSDSQPPSGANRELYDDATMDALLEAGRSTSARGVRATLYRQVQHLAARDLPLVPLWYQHNVTVRGADVQGWEMTPGGGIDALAHTSKGAGP